MFKYRPKPKAKQLRLTGEQQAMLIAFAHIERELVQVGGQPGTEEDWWRIMKGIGVAK